MMRFFTFLLTAMLLAPLAVQASPIIRVADTITLGSTELVDGDWYSAGGTVTLSGSVNGDAYIAAGTVVVNAPVKADLVVAGGAVRINANVGDDVRVLGGDVTIAGVVGGDVLVMGGTIHITDTARIAGDVIVMAETATIEGTIAGEIFARVTTLTLNASVGGNVRVPEVSQFSLSKSTDVRGSITYSAPLKLTQADTAKVTGKIEYTQTVLPGIDLGNIVGLFVAMILLACAVHGLFLKKLAQFAIIAHTRKGTAALVGIGGFIATPFLALLLLILGVTAPLGSLLLSLFIAYTITACGFAAILLGLYAYRLYKKIMVPTWTTTLIGATIVTILMTSVPFIAMLVIITVPLGILILETYRTLIGKGK